MVDNETPRMLQALQSISRQVSESADSVSREDSSGVAEWSCGRGRNLWGYGFGGWGRSESVWGGSAHRIEHPRIYQWCASEALHFVHLSGSLSTLSAIGSNDHDSPSTSLTSNSLSSEVLSTMNYTVMQILISSNTLYRFNKLLCCEWRFRHTVVATVIVTPTPSKCRWKLLVFQYKATLNWYTYMHSTHAPLYLHTLLQVLSGCLVIFTEEAYLSHNLVQLLISLFTHQFVQPQDLLYTKEQ